MNIAYLVLAHNKPVLLKRMIDRLDQPWAHFFIHIDSRSADLAEFMRIFNDRGRVTIISRYRIYWMGFNMVQSTLDLLQLALSSGISFKYYVLLSGQDYPVKSNSFIYNFFSKHNSDFMGYNRVADLPRKFREKYTAYHYMDVKYMNPRDPGRINFLVKAYHGLYLRLAGLLPARPFYRNLEPYFGAQWFALTHDTVVSVFNFLKKNPGYIPFMKHTRGPDELFFQSIILNSERKENVWDYDVFIKWITNHRNGGEFIPSIGSLHYMDWSDKGAGTTKPAILDEKDFEALKMPYDLFARKFDDQQSLTLLDRIDKELLAE